MYSDRDLGAGFDAAIAEEDKALKKLGRDPMNILQRNNIKKFDNNDPSSYPSNPEQRLQLSRSNSIGKTITSPKTKKGGGGVKMIPICKVHWDHYLVDRASP